MRVVKKNVYYCDFCGKKGLRSLRIHEKHCTANPDRECRLCENENPNIREIIEKYQAYCEVVKTDTDTFGKTISVKYLKEFTLQDIRDELSIDCPNCILTIIRCVGLNRFYFDKKFKYDYKKEVGKWWACVNAEEQRKNEWDTY